MEDGNTNRLLTPGGRRGFGDLLCNGNCAAIRTVGFHRECQSAAKVLKRQIPENVTAYFIKAAKLFAKDLKKAFPKAVLWIGPQVCAALRLAFGVWARA